MAEINLEGAYEQLKERCPVLHRGNCTECGITMITELHVSYIPDRQQRIKVYRPAHCQDCGDIRDPFIKLIAELGADGKIYSKDKEGRAK